MNKIRRQAIKLQQGKRVLFLSSFFVKDFLVENFYRVDRLDIQAGEGIQRLLNESRARRFGEDINDADEANEAFLPTSIFLATEGKIDYDEISRELLLSDESNVLPFDVVDGQHRIEGLKHAAGVNKRILDFPVSVVIAHELNNANRMLQFLTVNSKQEPVSSGVVQAITARFTRMLELEPLPYLPPWHRRKVEGGGDSNALDLVKALGSEEGSPWYNRVHFVDSPRQPSYTMKQAAFVNHIKRVILARGHPLAVVDFRKRKDILKNYWNAVLSVCGRGVEDRDEFAGSSAILKTISLEFFNMLLAPIYNVLARDRSYTKEDFEKILLVAAENLEGEARAILTSEFWEKGGKAAVHNKGYLVKFIPDFTKAISNTDADDIRV